MQLLHWWDFVIKEKRQPRWKIVTPRDPLLPETPYLYRNRAFSYSSAYPTRWLTQPDLLSTNLLLWNGRWQRRPPDWPACSHRHWRPIAGSAPLLYPAALRCFCRMNLLCRPGGNGRRTWTAVNHASITRAWASAFAPTISGARCNMSHCSRTSGVQPSPSQIRVLRAASTQHPLSRFVRVVFGLPVAPAERHDMPALLL
jgi:hypothetical protein